MKSRIGWTASLSNIRPAVCECDHSKTVPLCLCRAIQGKGTAERRLLGDEQVTTRGGGHGEAAADVALGVGERLQGEAVGDREEEGDDLLSVVAELQHSLALLGAQHVGDLRAGDIDEV